MWIVYVFVYCLRLRPNRADARADVDVDNRLWSLCVIVSLSCLIRVRRPYACPRARGVENHPPRTVTTIAAAAHVPPWPGAQHTTVRRQRVRQGSAEFPEVTEEATNKA